MAGSFPCFMPDETMRRPILWPYLHPGRPRVLYLVGSCASKIGLRVPLLGFGSRIKGERSSGWKIGVPRPRVDKSLSCMRYLSFPVALYTHPAAIPQSYAFGVRVQVTCYVICQRVLCNACVVFLFAIKLGSSICNHDRVIFHPSRAIYAVTPLEPASKKG